jgi:hypothetical protein
VSDPKNKNKKSRELVDQKVKGALERHNETVDSTKAQRFPFEFFSVASSSLVIKI